MGSVRGGLEEGRGRLGGGEGKTDLRGEGEGGLKGGRGRGCGGGMGLRVRGVAFGMLGWDLWSIWVFWWLGKEGSGR